MTTHIRVSSACTPAPLVFLLGLTKSPVGTARMLGVKTPLVPDMMGSGQFQSNAVKGRNWAVQMGRQCVY